MLTILLALEMTLGVLRSSKHFFLGIEVARSKEKIILSQQKYALDILEDSGLMGAKPIETSMDHNVRIFCGSR